MSHTMQSLRETNKNGKENDREEEDKKGIEREKVRQTRQVRRSVQKKFTV